MSALEEYEKQGLGPLATKAQQQDKALADTAIAELQTALLREQQGAEAAVERIAELEAIIKDKVQAHKDVLRWRADERKRAEQAEARCEELSDQRMQLKADIGTLKSLLEQAEAALAQMKHDDAKQSAELYALREGGDWDEEEWEADYTARAKEEK